MFNGPLIFLLLALGIAFIVVATTRYKVHPFLALLLTAYGVGLTSGLTPEQTLTALTGGFGRTVGAIGIVISCGCIIGTALERSGAALVMANAMLRLIGEGRALLAMSCTGAVVSIPVFCDSGYVLLSPLNRSLARRTGQSMAAFAVALSMGLYATHCLVPPTPGPIAAAGELRADLGMVILFGLFVTVPVVAATYLYAVHAGRRLHLAPPAPVPETAAATTAPAPLRPTAAFAPILLPVLLIAAKSVADLPSLSFGAGARNFLGLVGNPSSALILGVFLTWFVVRRHGRTTFGAWSGEGLRDAGTIILITAAGGAFGAVLRETPMARIVGELLASLSLGRFKSAASLRHRRRTQDRDRLVHGGHDHHRFAGVTPAACAGSVHRSWTRSGDTGDRRWLDGGLACQRQLLLGHHPDVGLERHARLPADHRGVRHRRRRRHRDGPGAAILAVVRLSSQDDEAGESSGDSAPSSSGRTRR